MRTLASDPGARRAPLSAAKRPEPAASSRSAPADRDRSGPWRAGHRHERAERRERKGDRARIRAGAARQARKERQVPGRDDAHRRPLHRARRAGAHGARSRAPRFSSRSTPMRWPRAEKPARCAAPPSTRCRIRPRDAEAARLADSENRADAIAGVDLSSEPEEVADILIDLAQRETKNFSHHFARTVVGELEERRQAAQASAEVGRVQGAEGAGRAVGADRTRLHVEQAGPEADGLGGLARQARSDAMAQAVEHVLCDPAGGFRAGAEADTEAVSLRCIRSGRSSP